MKRTGIFFHYQDSIRLQDFPQALEGILDKDNVFLYDACYPSKTPSSFDLEAIPEEWLYDVHSRDMVDRVRRTGEYEGALFSAAGTVSASLRIWRGEIDNAFVFTGYGDHHAGKSSFGGGCYFNGAAIAIQQLRRQFGAKRLAILDTDAHHGNGTWEIFQDDEGVLYVCFCSGRRQDQNNKVNVEIPWRVSDEEYVDLVQKAFLPRARAFAPEVIFWNWGYDGTRGEYGDIGLTPDVHLRLARLFKEVVEEVCGGKLIVVLCGGHSRKVANYAIPRIVTVLGEAD